MVEGVGDTKTGGEGDKHKVAPVVKRDGVNVEGSLAMSRPRLPLFSERERERRQRRRSGGCDDGWVGGRPEGHPLLPVGMMVVLWSVLLGGQGR